MTISPELTGRLAALCCTAAWNRQMFSFSGNREDRQSIPTDALFHKQPTMKMTRHIILTLSMSPTGTLQVLFKTRVSATTARKRYAQPTETFAWMGLSSLQMRSMTQEADCKSSGDKSSKRMV